MGSYFSDVVAWRKAVGHSVRSHPDAGGFDGAEGDLALELIDEEFSETVAAWTAQSLPKVADGLADLIWVICGAAAQLGIDLDSVWEEVRRSNFDKVGGPVREDGKILKPEGWRGPDIEGALDRGRIEGNIE